MARAVLQNPSARAEWLRQSSAPLVTCPLSTAGLATTTSTTLRLTQQSQSTMMTLSPSRAARMKLCSHQVSLTARFTSVRGGVRLSADDGSPTQ